MCVHTSFYSAMVSARCPWMHARIPEEDFGYSLQTRLSTWSSAETQEASIMFSPTPSSTGVTGAYSHTWRCPLNEKYPSLDITVWEFMEPLGGTAFLEEAHYWRWAFCFLLTISTSQVRLSHDHLVPHSTRHYWL